MLLQSHRLLIIQLRHKLWTRVESQCSPSSTSKEDYRNIEDRVHVGIAWGVNALLDKETRNRWAVIFTRRVGLSWKKCTVTFKQIPSVVSIHTGYMSLPKGLYWFCSGWHQFHVSLHFSVSINIFLVYTLVCERDLRLWDCSPGYSTRQQRVGSITRKVRISAVSVTKQFSISGFYSLES